MNGDEREMTEKRHARLTIGYLTPHLHEHLRQWSGVFDAAREHDVNLIAFPGWSPHYPLGFDAQANILYELAAAENVDGLVTWASSLGNYMTVEELQAFHERYRPLPMVGIGRALEGIPTLLMDSYLGMRDAIVHLIEVHGYRRLAFIRGPATHFYAQERYRAYTETLEAHGIPFDPNLVTPPSVWGRSAGIDGAHLLLDERKLRPQTDFEAVIAVSDDTLLGALEVLRERGIRVPGDVAIAGFDDRVEGRTSTPPLTTVASPFYEVGYQALETLLRLMEGEQVSQETVVPSRLVVRQSCGCQSSAVVQAAVGVVKVGRKGFETALSTQREEIVARMVQAVEELGGRLNPAWAGQLLDGFAAELEGELAGAFLAVLDEVLGQVATAGGDVASDSIAVMQNAVSTLRRGVLPYLKGEVLSRAEDMWQQARVMIGEMALRAQASEQLQAEQRAEILREIGSSLITAFDMAELMDVLAERLPQLGIRSCYLALYEDPQPYEYPQPAPAWSRIVLGYNETNGVHPDADARGSQSAPGPVGRIDLPPRGVRFPSRQLVPAGMLPQGRRYTMIAKPLYFRESQLGFVFFEGDPLQTAIYDTLRGEISSALYGALLVQQTRAYAVRVQTATEVSRAVSSTLDLDVLVQQVVDLVQERFDLYYTGLFLVDQTGEWTRDLTGRAEPGRWAVLRAASGEAGRQMLERGHRLEVGGESMIGWCIANRQARIALDVGKEAVRLEHPLLPKTRSELALPLISRGEAIGALTIQSAQEAAFSDEDVAVLQTMASQIAVAIGNARLFEEMQLRAEEMVVLNELSQALSTHLSVQDVLSEVYQGASRLLDATNFYVALYDPDAHEVTFPLDITQEEEDLVPALSADRGLTGYVIRHRTSLLIEENVSERMEEMGIEVVGKPCLSWLGAPMVAGDQVLGMVGVQSFTMPRAYDEHDRDLLVALANHTANAIANARLFEQAQTALQEMEAVQRRYLRRVWSEYARTREVRGYEQTGDGLVPLDDAVLPEVRQALQEQRTIVTGGSDGRSVLVVPIILRGQPLGALGFRVEDSPERWSRDDILMAEDVSEQFALAAENLRLLDETQRRAARERVISEVTSRIRQSLDMERVLRAATDEIYQALGLERVVVRLKKAQDGADREGSTTGRGELEASQEEAA